MGGCRLFEIAVAEAERRASKNFGALSPNARLMLRFKARSDGKSVAVQITVILSASHALSELRAKGQVVSRFLVRGRTRNRVTY